MPHNKGRLRVWFRPQVPISDAFHVEVNSVAEAINALNVIANYDNFLVEKNIKGDDSNAAGLEVIDGDGDWVDWMSEDGFTIDEITLEEAEIIDGKAAPVSRYPAEPFESDGGEA